MGASAEDTRFSSPCPGSPGVLQADPSAFPSSRHIPMVWGSCGLGGSEGGDPRKAVESFQGGILQDLPTASSLWEQNNPGPAGAPSLEQGAVCQESPPRAPQRCTSDWNPKIPNPGFFPSPRTVLEFLSTALTPVQNPVPKFPQSPLSI